MLTKKTLMTIAATVFVAGATGYYMENGLAPIEKVDGPAPRPNGPSRAAPKVDTSEVKPGAKPVVKARPVAPQTASVKHSLPKPPSQALIPVALPVAGVAELDVPEDTMSVPPAPTVTARSGFDISCEPVLAAAAAEGAMIDVSYTAACNPGERIVVSHAGLRFTQETDGNGEAVFSIPAMTRAAMISVETRGGEKATTSLVVPAAEDFDRVGLQWSGADELSIHALEFGAKHGAPGHVSALDPKAPQRSLVESGGFLTRLGALDVDDPIVAEVYSFPTGRIDRAGVVRLSIEALVTPYTCGQTVNAETFQTARDGTVNRMTLAIEVPTCDAVGDIVVLKNLLRDLKIAQK